METNYMNGSGIPYKNGMPDGSGMPGGGKKMMTPEEKKKANCLCVLSLCLCYGPIVLGGFIMAGYLIVHDITIFQPFINSLDENESLATGLTLLAETVQSQKQMHGLFRGNRTYECRTSHSTHEE